jgi:hypothetical protein
LSRERAQEICAIYGHQVRMHLTGCKICHDGARMQGRVQRSTGRAASFELLCRNRLDEDSWQCANPNSLRRHGATGEGSEPDAVSDAASVHRDDDYAAKRPWPLHKRIAMHSKRKGAGRRLIPGLSHAPGICGTNSLQRVPQTGIEPACRRRSPRSSPRGASHSRPWTCRGRGEKGSPPHPNRGCYQTWRCCRTVPRGSLILQDAHVGAVRPCRC